MQEVVIGGWKPGAGTAGMIGSLLLGLPDEHGLLRYAGGVGLLTGFTEALLRDLKKRLRPLEQVLVGRRTRWFRAGPTAITSTRKVVGAGEP